MIIIYVDIILLVVLLVLTIFACSYCFYKVYKMRQKGQVAVFLKPTRVLFRHKKPDENNAQLRTVVAYQNPLTGDYCIHKAASPKVYVNHLNQFNQPVSPQSMDSGLSDDAYEPLHTEGGRSILSRDMDGESSGYAVHKTTTTTTDNNSIDRTWNWQYKEYQI